MCLKVPISLCAMYDLNFLVHELHRSNYIGVRDLVRLISDYLTYTITSAPRKGVVPDFNEVDGALWLDIRKAAFPEYNVCGFSHLDSWHMLSASPFQRYRLPDTTGAARIAAEAYRLLSIQGLAANVCPLKHVVSGKDGALLEVSRADMAGVTDFLFEAGSRFWGESDDVLAHILDICRCLRGVHAAGYVVGDLCPDRVKEMTMRKWNEPSTERKLGLMCLSRSMIARDGAYTSWKQYASWEVIKDGAHPSVGREVDVWPSPASDVYALGCYMVYQFREPTDASVRLYIEQFHTYNVRRQFIDKRPEGAEDPVPVSPLVSSGGWWGYVNEPHDWGARHYANEDPAYLLLIDACLRVDPARRPTLDEVISALEKIDLRAPPDKAVLDMCCERLCALSEQHCAFFEESPHK